MVHLSYPEIKKLHFQNVAERWRLGMHCASILGHGAHSIDTSEPSSLWAWLTRQTALPFVST